MIRKGAQFMYVIATAAAAVAVFAAMAAPEWCYDMVLVLLVAYFSERA